MNKKTKLIFVAAAVLGVIVFWILRARPKADTGQVFTELKPVSGSIQTVISTTGTILPKNRLEIKPPVNGRLESLLVKEGQQVKAGDTLAWMSSTERAALLDAAQGQGPEKLKYWQQAYKPIALLAPIDGEVIVATTQPGQTITTSDAVIVLSDHLIARAQVDETDIGRIKTGQGAVVYLDAYPDQKINAVVEHIYYESETVNNVTVYKVDLLPEDVPEFFRSGMNATIDFLGENNKNALIVPLEAVTRGNDGDYCLIRQAGSQEPVKRAVKLGASDEKNIEVISGLDQGETVVYVITEYSLPVKEEAGSNPFMPNVKKNTKKSSK
ncbi:MAG: HlyD family efflux transporter periplasmic adaptor subunit [Candidatus Omnitrophica bacterium]|nr:HlyD family efflux transporter periplasmic adaptor subunit [Candidatus Omnitrophota bacterium]MDD5771362.1 HlyD family efflux transporter periplasmic adaptor subunit [Candidatus Omnitrophota bacterium]